MERESPHLEIANRQRRVRLLREEIGTLVSHVLEEEGKEHSVAIAFVGVQTMRCLNREWMGEDRPTDVLSFLMGDPPPGPCASDIPSGEIVICTPICEESSRTRAIDLHREVARMLIHGLLHLLGYDHATGSQQRRMRLRERRYLDWYRRKRLCVVEAR